VLADEVDDYLQAHGGEEMGIGMTDLTTIAPARATALMATHPSSRMAGALAKDVLTVKPKGEE
jgi:hypothetical protein